MRIQSVLSHSVQVVLEGALIAMLVVGLMAGTALAGKPGGGGSSTSSSLTLVLADDANGNGLPNWADTVTFTPSTNATTSPQVSLDCTQGGQHVYNANAAWYVGNPFAYMQMMKLTSGAWTSGAADCTAKLYYSSGKRTVTLKTITFHVEA